jgi:hypothetical protein
MIERRKVMISDGITHQSPKLSRYEILSSLNRLNTGGTKPTANHQSYYTLTSRNKLPELSVPTHPALQRDPRPMLWLFWIF